MSLLSSITEARNARSTGGVANQLNSGVLKTIVVVLDAGGAAGTADDVDIFAQDAFGGTGPDNVAEESFGILSAEFRVYGVAVGSTVQLFTQAAGAGVPKSSAMASDVLARVESTLVPVQGIDRGGKLFLRRSDRSVTGALILTVLASPAS